MESWTNSKAHFLPWHGFNNNSLGKPWYECELIEGNDREGTCLPGRYLLTLRPRSWTYLINPRATLNPSNAAAQAYKRDTPKNKNVSQALPPCHLALIFKSGILI